MPKILEPHPAVFLDQSKRLIASADKCNRFFIRMTANKSSMFDTTTNITPLWRKAQMMPGNAVDLILIRGPERW